MTQPDPCFSCINSLLLSCLCLRRCCYTPRSRSMKTKISPKPERHKLELQSSKHEADKRGERCAIIVSSTQLMQYSLFSSIALLSLSFKNKTKHHHSEQYVFKYFVPGIYFWRSCPGDNSPVTEAPCRDQRPPANLCGQKKNPANESRWIDASCLRLSMLQSLLNNDDRCSGHAATASTAHEL